jgi:hypothetical protein
VEYRELLVKILNRQSIQVLKPPGVMVPGQLPVPMTPLQERTINVLNGHLAAGTLKTREELVVLGSHLFGSLLDDSLRRIFIDELEIVKKRNDAVLRLVLEFELAAKELAELPWEYLYFPDGVEGRGTGFFVAADPESRLILARHVPLYPQLEATPTPLVILVVVSQPERYPKGEPELGEVVSAPVTRALEKLQADSNGAIVAKVLMQPTKQTLAAAVAQLKPHVVHFLGHGKYEAGTGGSLALLEEDEQTLAWVSDIDLPNSLLPEPRLVFLHACEGAHSDSYAGFRGVGLRLVYSRIPAVVAMQYQVENRVANRFALKFYESLSQGKRIDEAVQDGRRELGMYLDNDSFSSRAFGSPVVFLQNAQEIIRVPPPEAELKSAEVVTGARLRCPNCNADVNSEKQAYCFQCPAVLSRFPRCTNCGQFLPNDARRCGDCGTPVGAAHGVIDSDLAQRVSQPRAASSEYAAKTAVTLPGEESASQQPPPDADAPDYRRGQNGN